MTENMDATGDKITENISQLANEYAQKVSVGHSEGYFQEAVMKTAVKEVAWALEEVFKDDVEFIDQWRLMADIMEQHQNERTEIQAAPL